MELLETEYPMAALPELSTAMLGINRYKPSPALVHVCCCAGVAGKLPPVTSNWYQRTPVGWVQAASWQTVLAAHNDSLPPSNRYTIGVMILSPRVWIRLAVPCCGTIVKPFAVVNASTNGATVIREFGLWLAPTPRVELAGVAKST